MRIFLMVAAVALAVGACTGSGDEGDGKPAEGSAPGSSVEELAGKMATSEREAGQIADELDSAGCTADGPQEPVCGTILDRSPFVAETVLIVLDRDPPAEVEALAGDTRDAAQLVVDKHKQWDGADCATGTNEECGPLTQDLQSAVESLHKQLAGWSQHAK